MFYLIRNNKEIEPADVFMSAPDSVCVTKKTASKKQLKIIEWYELLKNKASMINEYKDIQKNIVSIKSELQEIEDTYSSYNTQGKQIADMQKTALNAKLDTLREQKNTIVLEGVKKYGQEVLQELI